MIKVLNSHEYLEVASFRLGGGGNAKLAKK